MSSSFAPVWTGLDLYVNIYWANKFTGEPDSQSLLSYCFFENCSLSGSVNWVQRPGFGNPIRNLVSEDEWDLYTLDVGHLYAHYTDINVTDVFNRNKLLYLEMWLCGSLTTDPEKTDELHVLTKARAASFNLGFPENGNVTGQVSFKAPIYTRPVGPPHFQVPEAVA